MKTIIKNIVIVIALAAFLASTPGCYRGRQMPPHPLNIKTNRNFINADKLPRGILPTVPTEIVLIGKYPGNGNVYVASCLKLQRHGNIFIYNTENNLFTLKIKNPERIPGLPTEIKPDTIAILSFKGQYHLGGYAYWVPDTVDPGVNTLRLEINAQNYSWECSVKISAKIDIVQYGERIPNDVEGY